MLAQTRLGTLARQSAQKEVPTTSVSAPAIIEQATSPAPVPSTPRPQKLDDPNRRYTIIKREVPTSEPPAKRRIPTAPYVLSVCIPIICSCTCWIRPKVWSTKELEALRQSESGFTMYDAIPSSSALSTSSEVDPEVVKFLPLLRDYLQSMHSTGLCSMTSSQRVCF